MVTLRELSTEELYGPGHRLCAGCGAAITVRMVLKAMKRPVFVVNATGCLEVASTIYPYTAWSVPWVHGLFENAPAIASGIETMLKSKNNGRLDADVIVFGGDGGTFDIGLQALSGAFERRHDFVYVCYDNEAYMNCAAGDTLLFTADGLTRIDEIKKGEQVYAFDLNTKKLVLRKCSGIFDNGVKAVYSLSTLHHDIKATANHPFLVVKRNGRGKERTFDWKVLAELKPGDEIVVLKKLSGRQSFSFKPVIHNGEENESSGVSLPKISTPPLLKYFGLYVGDGWVDGAIKVVGFAIPENDRARPLVMELQKKLFNQQLISKADHVTVYVNSTVLGKFINSLGFGTGAKNKTIPHWVFVLPDEEKEAFVQGLLLSDGYVYAERSCRYISSSYELLRRLRLLLQTMDYRVGKIHWTLVKKGKQFPHMKMLKDTAYGYICFSKKRPWNMRKYRSQYRYQNPLIETENFAVEKVRKVAYVGRMPTYDLRVENDHNFIADGVVAHNTGIQRSSATPEGAWTTTTPVEAASPGKVGPKKDLIAFSLAHHLDYVATASTAYWSDFMTKIQKAAAVEGPALIHTISPCPLGWRFKTDQTIQMGRLAVQTRYFPLYEVEYGKYKMSVNPQVHPLDDFLRTQGRFSHLFKPEYAGELAALHAQVEERWAALQELCQGRHPVWTPAQTVGGTGC